MSLLRCLDAMPKCECGKIQRKNGDKHRPIKKRMAYSPPAEWTVPAKPDGMAPMTSSAAMTLRGPYPRKEDGKYRVDIRLEVYVRSTRAPTTVRTIKVAQSDTMLELPVVNRYVSCRGEMIYLDDSPTCSDVSLRSVLTASGMRGANANQDKLCSEAEYSVT